MRPALVSLFAFVLAPALVVIPGAQAAPQEATPHTLRLAFQKDTVVWHKMQSDMVMNMDMAGQKIETSVRIQMTMQSRVLEVLEGGRAKVERRVRRIQTSLSNPMIGDHEYDSLDEKSDPEMMADLAALVNKRIVLTMTSLGRVDKVELPEGFGEELSGQMDESEFESMFGRESVEFPEQPVAVGGTWKTKTDMPLGGGMGAVAMEVENKLVAFEDGVATIEQKIHFPEDQEIDTPFAGTMGITGKSSKGLVKVHLGRAELVQSDSSMDLTMKSSQMTMGIGVSMKLSKIDPPKELPPLDKGEGGR